MTLWECDFCGDEFNDEELAESHMKRNHLDQIAAEEWPRYVSEVE